MCEVGSRLVFGEIVGSRERLLSLRGFKSNETGVNWRKIKAEYLAGGISQRALSEKYGIPWGTFSKRTRKEKWTAARKQAEQKEVEKVSQKTADEVADNAVTLQRIKRKLLARVETMLDNFPDTNAGEKRERIGNADYIYKIKDLAAVYSSLEDKTIKASVDIEDLSPLTELLRGE